MPPKVSIVILQFNNSEDTIKCLQFVKELDYPNFEVIVVDNNSEPPHFKNTENYLKSQEKVYSFQFIASRENFGYAGGNNLGIKRALENGANYILIFNNDVEVHPDLLEKLLRTAQADEKNGIVGPLINENNRLACGGKITWLKSELSHIECEGLNIEQTLYHILYGKYYIPGSCMLIKSQTIEKIGLLPEEYFLYFEDVDYCLKAFKTGLKCAITADAVINHRQHGSTAKISPLFILRYHFRNSLYFNRKNGPFWAKILIYPWSLWIIGKQLVKLAIHRHPEQSKAILKGVIDFYKGRMGKI